METVSDVLDNATTWYPSWTKNGKLYSPWTDGNVNGVRCGSAGDNAATGHATILGDDPLHLQVVQAGTFKSSPRPYASRYPCGSLVVGGVWYYGTYCLHPRGTVERNGINYDWPWLGPFVGFRWSTDFGKSWHETPCTPAKPLFGEQALQGESVRNDGPLETGGLSARFWPTGLFREHPLEVHLVGWHNDVALLFGELQKGLSPDQTDLPHP